jgi:hypothetical protein
MYNNVEHTQHFSVSQLQAKIATEEFVESIVAGQSLPFDPIQV